MVERADALRMEFGRHPKVKRVRERDRFESAGVLLILGGLLIGAVAFASLSMGLTADPTLEDDGIVTSAVLFWTSTGMAFVGLVVRWLARRPRVKHARVTWQQWSDRNGHARVDPSVLRNAVPEWWERIVPLSPRLYSARVGSALVTVGALRRWSPDGTKELESYVLLAPVRRDGMPELSVSSLAGPHELTVRGGEVRLESIALDDRHAIRIAGHVDPIDARKLLDPTLVELLASSSAVDWRVQDGWVVFHMDVADSTFAEPDRLDALCEFASGVLEHLEPNAD